MYLVAFLDWGKCKHFANFVTFLTFNYQFPVLPGLSLLDESESLLPQGPSHLCFLLVCLSFLLDSSSFAIFQSSACSHYYAGAVHFYCMDCAACLSLWRSFLEPRPSHTHGTPLCYGCCVHPHAACIRCSALHPGGASLGFDCWKQPSFFLDEPPPFALVWVKLHSISVWKAFPMHSSASSNLQTLWGIVSPWVCMGLASALVPFAECCFLNPCHRTASWPWSVWSHN